MRFMIPSIATWLSRLWPVLLVAGVFLVLAVVPVGTFLAELHGLGAWRLTRLLTASPLIPQIIHVGVFAGLALLSARALEPLPSVRARYFLAFAGTFAFGGFVESLQYFVPGRENGLFDMALNGFGALIGCAVGFGLRPKPRLA